jgi:hypothetical protein
MDGPAEDEATPKKVDDADVMRTLRHDIKNQLSNIFLAIEQLRYELPDDSVDCIFYLDLISKSSEKINTLLKDG